MWNSEDDADIDTALASEKATPLPKKKKQVSKGKGLVSPSSARGGSAKRKNIKVRGSVDQSTESPSTPGSIQPIVLRFEVSRNFGMMCAIAISLLSGLLILNFLRSRV